MFAIDQEMPCYCHDCMLKFNDFIYSCTGETSITTKCFWLKKETPLFGRLSDCPLLSVPDNLRPSIIKDNQYQ